MKTIADVLQQTYVNKSDIKRMFHVTWKQAVQIYDMADQMDNDALKEFRVVKNKVRITSVCKLQGVTLATLKKLLVCEDAKEKSVTKTGNLHTQCL